MSWLNKFGICSLLPVFCLTACGFHPLYAENPQDSESKVFAGVKVDPIPGRMGQELHAALEDGLNPRGDIPPSPAFRLSATIVSNEAPIGVSRDGTVSRYNVYLDSHYTLYRTADAKAIATGNVRAVSSYNNLTNAYFSTYVSEQDAITRGIQELGEMYQARLAAYLAAGAPPQKVFTDKNAPASPNPLPRFYEDTTQSR